MHWNKIRAKCKYQGIALTQQSLYASIKEQKLYLYEKEKQIAHYQISTSRKPPSCVENSFGTPTGLHCISEKIGHTEPIGMIFKGRKPTGQLYQALPADEQTDNYITTRILRLSGLEAGINQGDGCDSFERYIYIHGCNHEELIGTPQSIGCIELKNHDIIDLFNKTKEQSILLIE